MKPTKTTLLTTTLLSLFLVSQTATAGDAPRDQAISGNSATEQYQYTDSGSSSRVNYSITESDLDEHNTSDIFTNHEH